MSLMSSTLYLMMVYKSKKNLLKFGIPLLLLIMGILFIACALPHFSQGVLIPAPLEIRQRALEYAYQYENLGTGYAWGGQDPLPGRLVVDCSGLVIRCYQYACEDFGFALPFNDTTSYGLIRYSQSINQTLLSPGDLLFMGEDGKISHVALFIQFNGDNIQFIDATLKPEVGINGVTTRQYNRTDSRFISYGRMFVQSKQGN